MAARANASSAAPKISDFSPRIPDDPSRDARYPPIKPEDIAYAEIFPPIGIARVGNSGSRNAARAPGQPIEAYLTPELPHTTPKSTEQFRDSYLKIKRQAARFRVYAYSADGQVLGEINSSSGYHLYWTINVANTKAAAAIFKGRLEEPTTELRNPDVQGELPEHMRSNLIVKPAGHVEVWTEALKPLQSVPIIGTFSGSRIPADSVDVDLGEAQADEQGRLIYIGGSGYAQCVTKDMGYTPTHDYPTQPDITSEFDNVDWVDSTCDGWISVSFYPRNGAHSPWRSARHDAYVISGPPDFARGIHVPTSLWDTIEDIYNKNSQSFVADPTVQFQRDIWPVLLSTYQISWVNKDAHQGHGPNGSGNFLPLKDQLCNPQASGKDQQLREHIFNRIRMPDYLNKDQGSLKWMPRLSGDDGDSIDAGTIKVARTYPNAIARFASLTSLQYDRFKRWKHGQFKNDQFPVLIGKVAPQKIEDVPLQLQPEYLTRAHLESTIGDPLFPGIEVYWIAKTPDVYDLTIDATMLSPPFRINPKLRAGDMTKGCSLPWQSDFSQCNTHWWPSARPDDVIPGERDNVLDRLKNIARPSSLLDQLDQLPREPWTRLMRLTPDNDSQFFPGCTDMVRWWTQLGFLRRIEFSGMPPFFIETDRLMREPQEDEDPPEREDEEGRINKFNPRHRTHLGVVKR